MGEKFLLRTVIILLLVINGGTLAYLWYTNRPPGGRSARPGNVVAFLTKELTLTTAQQDTLAALQADFKNTMGEAEENYRALHPPFFNLLSGQAVDSVAFNTALNSLVAGNRRLELLTFNHFRQIRAICNARQQKRFDEIVGEAIRMLAPLGRPQQGPPPPPGGHGPPPGGMPPPPGPPPGN